MKSNGMDKLEIESFFPIDNPYCVCKKQIEKIAKELMTMGSDAQKAYKIEHRRITCERDKTGLTKYAIICKKCGELQGTLWAKDETLKDWCDFHYFQWTDGENWHGCQTPNISPITLKLTIQCYCGVDTRDYRANPYFPARGTKEIEERNCVGRDYGNKDSKFSVMITGGSN